MQQNAASKLKFKKNRRRKRGDSLLLDDEGELTLLNLQDQEDAKDEIDDGIDRLDTDEERPFQSFAGQMKHNHVVSGNYAQLQSDGSKEETKKQLDEMSQDLARIKDKEQALDAENKILRAQLSKKPKKSKPSKAEPRDRAQDYHTLPGDQKDKKNPSKIGDRYS